MSNKQELQQMSFNHSSDIDFQDFMNLYKKNVLQNHIVLVIDAAQTSDNPFRFGKNTLEKM